MATSEKASYREADVLDFPERHLSTQSRRHTGAQWPRAYEGAPSTIAVPRGCGWTPTGCVTALRGQREKKKEPHNYVAHARCLIN